MKNDSTIKQVKDDPELLKLLLDDSISTSELYTPTNYWSFNEKNFLPELQSLGLKDFRRRKNSVLMHFGATDLFIEASTKPHSIKDLLSRTFRYLLKIYAKIHKLKLSVNNKIKFTSVGDYDLNFLYFSRTKSYGKKNGAKDIQNIQDL